MGLLCTTMCNEAERVGVKMFVWGFIRRGFSHRPTYLRFAKVGKIMQIYQSLGIRMIKLKGVEKIKIVISNL